ncbi:hypothetical protein [Bacillus sp. Marseille-P3661]|nr:hypothetical protein [Bacillus sp. Marseille-P3661]
MTKELAIQLMTSERIYLTEEGRKLLEEIIKEVTSNVPANR